MRSSSRIVPCAIGLLALSMRTSPAGWAAEGPASLVAQSGLTGGLIVVVDCTDGDALADLALNGRFVVQGLAANAAQVEAAREVIRQRGLYGQVSCNLYNGVELPYVDDLVNVVLCEERTRVSRDELRRVLAPGGLLLVKGAEGWQQTLKPHPAGRDEWHQFLHGADNNGVSLDNVGTPQRLRWHAAPEWGRSKALSPSVTNMVSADGLVFTIEDWATTEDVNAPVEYHLVARDAYNGIRLWHRPLKGWDQWQTNSIKSISTQQQRCLAALGERVYCCPEFGGPVRVFAARTGEVLAVFAGTERTREFALEDGILYGIQGAPYKLKGHEGSGEVKLYAADVKTGRLRWQTKIATEYVGGTLAVKGPHLVYYSATGLTCLRAADAAVLWTKSLNEDLKGLSGKAKPTPAVRRNTRAAPAGSTWLSYNNHPTVVLTDGVVLVGVVDGIVAKRLQSGETIWTAKGAGNYMKSPDLFVANGLVWGKSLRGLDLQTGETVTQLTQEVTGPMSHDRCYRNRITHRYYLNSASGGTDFLRLDGKAEHPNPWVRSTCGLAVMPANGMVYTGPYVCQCAIGVMVSGLNALYNGVGDSDGRFTLSLSPRVVKGQAFGYPGGAAATADDWPTYRGSGMRSGTADAAPPTQLDRKWRVRLGPKPTAPVVVGNAVYVASRESHTLYAVDRSDGKTVWSFTADGGLDSPPTYYRGLLLFGSRGGWVYCLRAADGKLVWRFNGLPERRLICDQGRFESAWPVNGSVLVHQDTVYFAAGRSSFLDGGIAVFGLDPFSGQVKYSRVMHGPYQDDRRDFPLAAEGTFQLEGFKSGIFSRVGDTLFIRHQAFTTDLTPVKLSDVKTLHLMASPGFLDASPQHRTYWTVDRNLRYGGPTGQFGAGPAGDTIAFDGRLFYEVRGYAPGRNLPGRGRGMSPLTTYSVFAGSVASKGEAGAWTGNARTIPAAGRWKKRWSTPTPFAGHALAASRTTVLAAGVPLLEGYSQQDTNDSFAGKKGGLAWLLEAGSGRKLQELRFDAAPTWDGIAIAHDHYFLSLTDGTLVCLGAARK